MVGETWGRGGGVRGGEEEGRGGEEGGGEGRGVQNKLLIHCVYLHPLEQPLNNTTTAYSLNNIMYN